MVLLDFVRSLRFTGTKEGCKEGDCGACTVLVGEIQNNKVRYKSVNSCLIPIENISGSHVVTIEGLNLSGKQLNPVQKAFADEGASQCGFCTPGFIVSLTGYLLNNGYLKFNNAVDALDGNICRCTGHNSIIRAAEIISNKFQKNFSSNGSEKDFLQNLVLEKIVPEYFISIKKQLEEIVRDKSDSEKNLNGAAPYYVSGGTDLFVQRPDEMLGADLIFLNELNSAREIKIENGFCHIGCQSTVTDILESELIQKYFPDIQKFSELFGSTPIRNSATIGGNINNASPIGDMTAFFMALNSNAVLSNGKLKREIPLNKYFLSYKKTERQPDEFLKSVNFKLPEGNYFFNFEKVSKRTYLDIATVNTAMLINVEGDTIISASISAGGVSAVPLYLTAVSDFLKGKQLNPENIHAAVEISQTEINPISDARGSSEYKRLLLSRLIYTHFVSLFPESINIGDTT